MSNLFDISNLIYPLEEMYIFISHRLVRIERIFSRTD